MMMLALANLAFGGGDLGDLARTLGRWSHAPVVALVQAERARPRGGGPSAADVAFFKERYGVTVVPLPPEWKPAAKVAAFEIGLGEVGDGKDLSRLVRAKARVETKAKDGSVALWGAAWQPSTTFVEGDGVPLPEGWTKAKDGTMRIEGGLATFALPLRQAVQASQIAALKWSRPVKVHWLLAQMWVVPVAERAGEKKVLQVLAWALSGKLVETKDEYRIDFDPIAFRPRAQASIAERSPKDARNPLATASAEIASRAWFQIDDATITALFAQRSPRCSHSRTPDSRGPSRPSRPSASP